MLTFALTASQHRSQAATAIEPPLYCPDLSKGNVVNWLHLDLEENGVAWLSQAVHEVAGGRVCLVRRSKSDGPRDYTFTLVDAPESTLPPATTCEAEALLRGECTTLADKIVKYLKEKEPGTDIWIKDAPFYYEKGPHEPIVRSVFLGACAGCEQSLPSTLPHFINTRDIDKLLDDASSSLVEKEQGLPKDHTRPERVRAMSSMRNLLRRQIIANILIHEIEEACLAKRPEPGWTITSIHERAQKVGDSISGLSSAEHISPPGYVSAVITHLRPDRLPCDATHKSKFFTPDLYVRSLDGEHVKLEFKALLYAQMDTLFLGASTTVRKWPTLPRSAH